MCIRDRSGTACWSGGTHSTGSATLTLRLPAGRSGRCAPVSPAAHALWSSSRWRRRRRRPWPCRVPSITVTPAMPGQGHQDPGLARPDLRLSSAGVSGSPRALRSLSAVSRSYPNLADSGRRGCLAVNTAAEIGQADAQTAAHVQRMFDRTEAAFEAAVIEGQSNGELARSADPKAIASLLLTTVVGMQVMVKSSPDTDRLHRVVDALLATI